MFSLRKVKKYPYLCKNIRLWAHVRQTYATGTHKNENIMKNAIFRAAIIVAAATVAIACCHCKSKSRAAKPLTGTQWTLVRLMGIDVAAEPDTFNVTFAEDGGISGVGACNRLMGSYALQEKGRIEIGPLASTRMMCPDMERETQFFGVLEGTTSYEIDGKMLLLFRDGEMRAVLEAK